MSLEKNKLRPTYECELMDIMLLELSWRYYLMSGELYIPTN